MDQTVGVFCFFTFYYFVLHGFFKGLKFRTVSKFLKRLLAIFGFENRI